MSRLTSPEDVETTILTRGLSSVQALCSAYSRNPKQSNSCQHQNQENQTSQMRRPGRSEPRSDRTSRSTHADLTGISISKKTLDFRWILTGSPSSSAVQPGSQVSRTVSRSASSEHRPEYGPSRGLEPRRAGSEATGIGPGLGVLARRSRRGRPARPCRTSPREGVRRRRSRRLPTRRSRSRAAITPLHVISPRLDRDDPVGS